MKVSYEFELGLIYRDSEFNVVEREPLHYCPKTEWKSLIQEIKDYRKENQEFDLHLIRWTTYTDWYDAEREELGILPNRVTSFRDVAVPKYMDKIIDKVLSEIN